MSKREKKLFRRWSYCRQGLNKLEFRWQLVGPGVWQITAWTERVGYPVGLVWLQDVAKNMVCVLHSYVPSQFRRAGVRTALNGEISRGWPDIKAIITGEASGKASRRWMEKVGYSKGKTGWRLDL